MTDLKVTIPTVHTNGTSKKALVEALENAVNAIRVAESSLAETAPNARDYYPQGNDAFKAAQQEHCARQDRLRNVRSELGLIWESIVDLGG